METTMVRFDADGYVDAEWAVETAITVLRTRDGEYTGHDVDEMVDWLREGDFRDGEIVEIARLANEWREYQGVGA